MDSVMSPNVRNLLALLLSGGAFSLGAVLFARAAVGAVSSGIPWSVRTIAALAAAALAWGGWNVAWSRRFASSEPVVAIAAGCVLVTVPTFLAVSALAGGGATVAGLVAGIGLVGAVTIATLLQPLGRLADDAIREIAIPTVADSARSPAPVPLTGETGHAHPIPVPDDSHRDILETARPTQTWTRTSSDGIESIEAEIAVRFAAGERQVFVHLPIQPSLPSTPTVECEPVDVADVELQVELATPFGVRLLARRGRDIAAPQTTAIAILLTAEPVARAA
jgi:hypothetical protein